MFCVPSQEKKVTVALLQGELWEALWEEKRILSDFFFFWQCIYPEQHSWQCLRPKQLYEGLHGSGGALHVVDTALKCQHGGSKAIFHYS